MEGLTPGVRSAVVTRVDGWRARMTVPSLLGQSETGWAEPFAAISPPWVGQRVWAMFEGDDTRYPIWVPRIQP